MSLPLLRRRADPTAINRFWQSVQSSPKPASITCPACFKSMLEVQFSPNASLTDAQPFPIDFCERCQFLWFDSHELAAIPSKPEAAPPKQLPQKARELIALHQVEKIRQQAEADAAREGPEHFWQVGVALFGFPVEHNAETPQRHPIATWTISLLVLIVSVLVFNGGDQLLHQLAFIPNDPFRSFGLTWLTSFFVHGGILHLVGNLYFLLVFGDNVEDTIGRKAFLAVLFGGTILGHALHWMLEPRGQLPTVGASGGISAIIALYALAFPHVRLGMFVRFAWINFSARTGFLIWIGLQFLTAYRQIAGLSNISALAHLGGCLAGILYWLWFTRRAKD
jgi:membrane associated rhomboid family serine protease